MKPRGINFRRQHETRDPFVCAANVNTVYTDSAMKKRDEYVPRVCLLDNAFCKHSFLFSVAVKLDTSKERERCYFHHAVRNLEIATIIFENLSHDRRRGRGFNRR